MLSMSKIQGRMNLLASSELRRIGQDSSALSPIPPIRPSVIAGVGLAGFGLGSHFAKKNSTLKKGLIAAAVLSGIAGAWLLYSGK